MDHLANFCYNDRERAGPRSRKRGMGMRRTEIGIKWRSVRLDYRQKWYLFVLLLRAFSGIHFLTLFLTSSIYHFYFLSFFQNIASLLLLCFVLLRCTAAFYLPGIAPIEYTKGDRLDVKVFYWKVYVALSFPILYLILYLFPGRENDQCKDATSVRILFSAILSTGKLEIQTRKLG